MLARQILTTELHPTLKHFKYSPPLKAVIFFFKTLAAYENFSFFSCSCYLILFGFVFSMCTYPFSRRFLFWGVISFLSVWKNSQLSPRPTLTHQIFATSLLGFQLNLIRIFQFLMSISIHNISCHSFPSFISSCVNLHLSFKDVSFLAVFILL